MELGPCGEFPWPQSGTLRWTHCPCVCSGWATDVSGLWEAEAEWSLFHRDDERGPARQVVATKLAELAGLGLIEVYAGPERLERADNPRVPLTALDSVLADPASWRVPQKIGDHAVRYETTEKGFNEYKKAVGWSEA